MAINSIPRQKRPACIACPQGVGFACEGNAKNSTAVTVIPRAVVSCSATETPRLLFQSATPFHPHGLGNRSDWLGRNLQGHAYCGADSLFETELFDGLGPAARIASCRFSHGLPGGRKGSALMGNELIREPYLFSRAMIPPGVPRWGAGHKHYVQHDSKRSISLRAPVQETPVFESRVQLAPE
jgi:hypothetical protein